VDITPEYRKALMTVQGKGGRPTKCTPEMIRAILSKIRKGHPYVVACRSLGISYRTMRRWVEKGERPGSPEPFCQFCHDIRRASAEAEGRLAAQWLALAEEKREWRGIWKYMACRWPQRWSERRQGDSTPVTVPIRRELNFDGMSIQEVRDLRDGMARVLTKGEGFTKIDEFNLL